VPPIFIARHCFIGQDTAMARKRKPYILIKRTLSSGKIAWYYRTPDRPTMRSTKKGKEVGSADICRAGSIGICACRAQEAIPQEQ